MTQIIVARLAQQAERAAKDRKTQLQHQQKLLQHQQSLDNEDFRPTTAEIFDQNANDMESPDYRYNEVNFFHKQTHFVITLIFIIKN